MALIEVVRGSLLDQDVEAIVNAANTSMRGGSGLDGAIHRAAGRELMDELTRVAPHGAKTGQIVVTPGFATGFRFILHTPGPVWQGGTKGEQELLSTCYRNAVLTAERLGVKSLGFASISTGVYRYPLSEAAPLALKTIMETITSIDRVGFAMYGAEEHDAFADALAKLS